MSRLLLSFAAMLMLGIAAGFVWLTLANPAEWEARAEGIVLTEAAARGQFSVIVTFVAVGAVASVLWGAFLAKALDDLGWLLTPIVIASSVIVAVVAWRFGVWQGPPDPASVTGVAVGDRVPAKLAVDGFSPFVVWPIFGLIGHILMTLLGTTRTGPRQHV
ncbi:hypothetical protein [Aeromicrobium sp.]|uniref:hypothetical protein n=1 Tax=Aeromicrobium sp. TaxID=1871063 RepID=UPI0030C61B03